MSNLNLNSIRVNNRTEYDANNYMTSFEAEHEGGWAHSSSNMRTLNILKRRATE